METTETMMTMEPQNKQKNPVMEQNTGIFFGAAMLYGMCFAIAFYNNYVGITFPLIIAATLVVCGLFLKKSEIAWKTQNICYVIPVILLGISTMLTTNTFTVFFNTVGIVLLIAVFMMQQIYPNNKWNLIQYIRNILVLYTSMITKVVVPFTNLHKYIQRKRETKQKNPNIKYVVKGIIIGLPMLFFVLVLLSSADVVFSEYMEAGFGFLRKNSIFSPNGTAGTIMLLIVTGFFGIYTFLSALTSNNISEASKQKEKKNPITAVTFITMITMVYLMFCIIQIVYLFCGGMTLPEGYTYAEYAHQGFFQLLFLCIFNLMLVLCCMTKYEMSRLLKIVLTVFSGCTYIMIASSAYRMLLYIDAFYLTFLRILVLWFLALLAVLMAGVMRSIIKENFSLFRYGMIVVTIFYLVFSFGHPDYWIAKYNISMMKDEMDYTDVSFLCSLSLDAAPALAEIRPVHEHDEENWCTACKLESYFEEIEDTELSIRTFNLSKYQAVKKAEKYLDR